MGMRSTLSVPVSVKKIKGTAHKNYGSSYGVTLREQTFNLFMADDVLRPIENVLQIMVCLSLDGICKFVFVSNCLPPENVLHFYF